MNEQCELNMGSSGSFQPFADQRSAFGEDFSFSSESVPSTTWLQLTEVNWERLVDFWSLIRVLRGHGIENYLLLWDVFVPVSPCCSPPQGFAAGIWSVFIHPLTPLRVREFWSSNLFVPLWSSGAEIPRTLSCLLRYQVLQPQLDLRTTVIASSERGTSPQAKKFLIIPKSRSKYIMEI